MKKLMSNKVIKVIFIILILIVLDQGLKLIVHNTVASNDKLFTISNTIHIHPYLNDEDAQSMLPVAESKNMDVRVLLVLNSLWKDTIVLLIGLFICGWVWVIFWDLNMPKNPLLLQWGLSLVFSGVICSNYVDEYFWGGSLDFICIAFDKQVSISDHYHTVPKHIIFDAKDIFIWIGLALLIVYVFKFLIWAVKIDKDKEASQKISYRVFHPIKAIKEFILKNKLQEKI